MSEDSRVRQNWWANILAAVACFVLEAAWYSLFLKQWLSGISRTMDDLAKSGINPLLQYAAALAAQLVMAAAISCVVQLTGPQTAWPPSTCSRSAGPSSASTPASGSWA